MLQVFQTTFPPATTPIVDARGNMTNDGMAFLRALFGRTGLGTGIVDQVDDTVTANGSVIGTATALTSDWNVVAHAAGSDVAVQLPALTGGQSCVVFNQSDGAATLTIFPPSGATIDGTSSYSLASTKMQIFWYIDQQTILSTQLG